MGCHPEVAPVLRDAATGFQGFLRFAQDFGRRLERRLNASTSLAAVAQNDILNMCTIWRENNVRTRSRYAGP